MEKTDSTAEPSEELNPNRHWVETLFPPRFTFQDLLTETDRHTDKPQISPTKCTSLNLPYDNTESRRQIYMAVLKEIQHKEAEIKRRNLAQRIRDEQPICRSRPCSDVQHKDSCDILYLHRNGKDSGLDRCLWNKEDISQLRIFLAEMDKDRWRLREQLRSSEEQLKSERETRRRLQALLEDREGQLELSRKEAARHCLSARALKVEAHRTNVRLQELTRQSSQQADEVAQLRADLTETQERHRQFRREQADLARELERAREQEWTEAGQRAEAVRVECEAAVAGLRRKVEEVSAALREEEEMHGCSRMALELLRRHISKQQHGEVQDSHLSIMQHL